MSHQLRRAVRRRLSRCLSPSHPAYAYVQYIATLLVVVLAGFAVCGTTGCVNLRRFGNTVRSTPSDFLPNPFDVVLRSSPQYMGGELDSIEITVEGTNEPPPERVTIKWWPPEGATAFEFPEGRMPDNPGGPPPYRWSDVPWETAQKPMLLSFTAPTGAPSTNGGCLVNMVVVDSPDGPSSVARISQDPGYGLDSVAGFTPRPRSEDEHSVWEVERTTSLGDNTALDDDSGQALIEYLRTGAMFFAVRLPGAPEPEETYGQSLPWVDNATQNATLRLVAGDTTLYQADLAIAPGRMAFASSHLGSSEGDQWLTFCLAADAPDYAGPSADTWLMETTIYLDLGDRGGGGERLEIESYVCYEGQDEPTLSGIQTDGITAYGPFHQTLLADPDWRLDGGGSVHGAAGETLQFRHVVHKNIAGEIELNVSFVSSLGMLWYAYGGDEHSPDLSQPLGNPITVDQDVTYVWIVSDPLWEGATGPHYITLQLAQGYAIQRISSAFWAGDWTAPPAAPTEAPVCVVALPMVVRE